MHPLTLSPDRLFPADPTTRSIARALYAEVANLPIISPHGHTDPAWFATNAPWSNATELLLAPDHYLFRMLYSQGIALDDLGVPHRGGLPDTDPRALDMALDAQSADQVYDAINAALATDAFRPRALFERFNIELLATTEGADDDLRHHQAIRESGWQGRVVTTYRPDSVIDPEHEEFRDALVRFGNMTGEDVESWQGYLAAHAKRRADFRAMGATATDHGFATPRTANLSTVECEALFAKIVGGTADAEDAELFRAQMLTEMAKMSQADGMVMQIHPGSCRNHNTALFHSHGRDKGADIPMRTDYVGALKPMLDVVGNDANLTIILFTLDETTYARELAPLAGHYPCLRLGPAWWFHDSPE
ncbi:MAG: glucuronate isomerase, partial [Sphingobium sp.]